jgi:hypothetical protein
MALRGRFQKGISWHGRGTVWEQRGNGMACVNQTRPHYVNQMGKTQSKVLAERHGRGMAGEQQGNGMGTAWERHGMCESALNVPTVLKSGPLYFQEPFIVCSTLCRDFFTFLWTPNSASPSLKDQATRLTLKLELKIL